MPRSETANSALRAQIPSTIAQLPPSTIRVTAIVLLLCLLVGIVAVAVALTLGLGGLLIGLVVGLLLANVVYSTTGGD